MTDIIENFFNAYCTEDMRSVYTDRIPIDMLASPIDKEGWFDWKLIPGTLTTDDYEKIEKDFKVIFPDNFIEWHKRYFYSTFNCYFVRFSESLPTRQLEDLVDNFNYLHEDLLSLGLIPFADEGNDSGPLVFDTRGVKDRTDFPIRVFDHEYEDDLEGLSEVVFSSFNKMLECLTHFKVESKTRKKHEIISDFFKIDPSGAGLTGKAYWKGWEMSYEEFEK